VWTFSLRMSFVFERPSCGRALRCVGVPNLRTCGRALRLRCGPALGHPTCAHALCCIGAPNYADGSCVAFGCPSCGCAFRCIGAPNLGGAVLKSLPPSQNFSYPSSNSSFSLVLPCVDVFVFVADEFCVWAPIMRTCLALHWGAQPW
jgi:hypothetical protein